MSKTRTWMLGIGCLVVVVGVVLVVLAVCGLVGAGMPGKVVLAVHLDGPIAELRPEDPLAELMGDTTVGLRDLRNALVRAAEDDRVLGVRLRIDRFGGGMAAAQEIRALLSRVREAGKWSAAYLDTVGEFAPGNLQYYVAAACDEVSINPMGDVNLIGLSVRTPFIRGTLDKLDINPEFKGRGDYKTARFMYTEKEFTDAHLEMMEWLVDSVMDQLVEDIASSRGLEPSEVRRLVDRAPFLGEEALEVRLVDRLEDWGTFTARLEEGDNAKAKVLGLRGYLRRSKARSSGPRIAVVTAVGAIMRGKSQKSFNPLLGSEVMGSDTIAKAWRDVRDAGDIRAAVFRVDSPGGSAVASEVIRQEMARTAEKIPVVVSMSNLAASGGYWISCGAQRIVAYPGTLTGSIGVFAGHINMDDFWDDKLGVTYGRIDRGANAAIYGDLEDWTDSQRQIVDRMLDRIYGAFLDRVSASRSMSREAVDAIGQGRVFTGAQGADNGLVDLIGGFDAALNEAKRLANIGIDEPVRLVDFPKVKPIWQQILEQQKEEETAIRAGLETLDAWWRTGRATVPGVVWMSPVYVE